jgi:hypothetical protein
MTRKHRQFSAVQEMDQTQSEGSGETQRSTDKLKLAYPALGTKLNPHYTYSARTAQ